MNYWTACAVQRIKQNPKVLKEAQYICHHAQALYPSPGGISMPAKAVHVVLCILAFSMIGLVEAQSEQAASRISQQELMQRMDAQTDVLILDVRTSAEFSAGHIPGAINIPHVELPSRLGEVQPHRAKEVVVYCEAGGRAGIAEHALREAGFVNVRHLEGDMAAWRQTALPIVTRAR